MDHLTYPHSDGSGIKSFNRRHMVVSRLGDLTQVSSVVSAVHSGLIFTLWDVYKRNKCIHFFPTLLVVIHEPKCQEGGDYV